MPRPAPGAIALPRNIAAAQQREAWGCTRRYSAASNPKAIP